MSKKFFPGNEGAKRLLGWMLGPPRRTQSDLANELGVSQQTISGWVNGSVPGPLYRMLIEKRLGIPFSCWPDVVEDDDDGQGNDAPLSDQRAV